MHMTLTQTRDRVVETDVDHERMLERLRAENARSRHEECVVGWRSLAVENLAVKTNDWLVAHPGWRVKHQSLAALPETDDSHPIYVVLVTMEKGDR